MTLERRERGCSCRLHRKRILFELSDRLYGLGVDSLEQTVSFQQLVEEATTLLE
jgi:hypothetical protein